MASNYTINDIETLSFRDGVRKRIAMYLGSADMQGVYNAIQEIISNSIDEFYMGYGKKISVELEDAPEGQIVTVVDDGRGIPFGIKPDGTNVLVDIFSRSHTGGKFNDKVYQSVGGLNGIGGKATCLSSLNFMVTTHNSENIQARAQFKEGNLVSYEEKPQIALTASTEVRFILDPTVYNLEPIQIDFEVLKNKCRNLSYLTKGLTFQMLHRTADGKQEKVEYCAKNGLLDLLKDTVKDPVHSIPVYYETVDGKNQIEIALQWTKGKEHSFVFTNGLLNSEGGTSLTGLRTAITRNMKKICGVDADGEMTRTGLVYAISCKVPNPSFANQTKTKINNPELRSLADKAFSDAINVYKGKYPQEIEAITGFLSKEEKAEKAAQRAREAVLNHVKDIAVQSTKKVLLADKLKDCREHGENSMLIICEGDSAAGSLVRARDVDRMAIMPIRGKIINALKNPIEDVLANKEVNDILLALGCGINERYNSKRLRYGRVGIATDGDADGYNIMCLITTLFYQLMPDFLKEGRLCWLRAPLYRCKMSVKKDDYIYLYTDEELTRMKTSKKVLEVQRYKGLGEFSTEDMARSMLGEQNRLDVLTYSDINAANRSIEMLMGDSIDARKEFTFANIDFEELED